MDRKLPPTSSRPTLVTRRKTSFSISLPSSKLTISLAYSIYKHDAIYIAGPNSIRHKLRSPWSLCGSVVEDWSAESEDLIFDSSWGLRICYLSHARDKTKKIFLLFFTKLKTYHLSYAVYLPPTCFSIPASPT